MIRYNLVKNQPFDCACQNETEADPNVRFNCKRFYSLLPNKHGNIFMGAFNNHVDKRRGVDGQSNVHEFPSLVPRWSMKSPRGQIQN